MRRKVFFHLQQDEDGYPPVAVESVWATADAGGWTIDNIPFFTSEATLGDVVAVRSQDDQIWFHALLRSNGHSLVRIVFFDKERRADVCAQLESMGCVAEAFDRFGLVAVDIAPSVASRPIIEHLEGLASDGVIDYEVALMRHA